MEDHVEAAVAALYGSSDESYRRQAENWLVGFQSHPEAWAVSLRLLHIGKSAESQYFASQTIHTLCRRSWMSLSSLERQQLRTQLLADLFGSGSGPPCSGVCHRIVLTRLALCVGAIVVRESPEAWPNVVLSLCEQYGTQNGTCNPEGRHRCQALLEVVTCLPDELHDADLTMQKRENVLKELQRGIGPVLSLARDMLSSCASSPHPRPPASASDASVRLAAHAIACLARWLPLPISTRELHSSGVLALLFDCLSSDALVQRASELLGDALGRGDAETCNMDNTALQDISSRFLGARRLYESAFQDGNEERCRALVQLASAVCAFMAPLLMSSGPPADAALNIVHILLECTQHPSSQVAASTFEAWCNILDVANDLSASQQGLQRLHAVIPPLVHALIRHAQWPEALWRSSGTHEGDSSTAEGADLHDFLHVRTAVEDVILYVAKLAPLPTLSLLLSVLQDHMNQMQSASAGEGGRFVEAVLFCVGAMSVHVPPEEEQLMPQLVVYCTSRLPHHPLLLRTALTLFGQYAHWLAKNASALFLTMDALLASLLQSQLLTAAALAIRKIALPCAQTLVTNSALVTTLLNTVRAIDLWQLKSHVAVALTEASGILISAAPASAAGAAVSHVTAPMLARLQLLSDAHPTADGRAAATFTLEILHSTSVFLDCASSDEDSHVVVALLQACMPCIAALAAKYIMDEAFAQALSGFLEGLIAAAGASLRPMLHVVLSEVTSWLVQTSHPCLITTLGAALPLAGHIAEDEDGGSQAVSSDLHAALGILIAHVTNIVRQDGAVRPDVLKAFFNTMLKAVKNCPRVLLTTVRAPSEPLVIAATEVCLSVLAAPSHPQEPTKRALLFLAELVGGSAASSPSYAPHVTILVARIAPNITPVLLQGAMGELPRSFVPPLTDVLFPLATRFPDDFSQAANSFMHQLFATSPTVGQGKLTFPEMHHFVNALVRNGDKKVKMKHLVSDFATRCLYPGTSLSTS